MRGRLFFHAPRLLKWASMSVSVIAPGWLASTCATARTWSGRVLGQFWVVDSLEPFLVGFLLNFECNFGPQANRGKHNQILIV